jgi:hypothetical protein
MRRYLGHLPSPAMVVSLIALFFALGGVGYAKKVVHFINGSTIKKGSIQVDRLSSGARAALKGNRGSQGLQGVQGLQGAQGPQGAQGSAGAAGTPATKLFGNFGEDGTLVRGKGIVSSERGATGFYKIQFNQDISHCVLLASPSSTSNTNPQSVTVGAAYLSPTLDTAFVLIRNDFADTRVNADFSLVAIC